MIVLICTLEPYRIDWMPQFVQHYRELGVERFLLSLQLDPGAAADEKQRHQLHFRTALAQLGVEPLVWEDAWNAPNMGAYHRRLKNERVGLDDWIVWTDSDEFQVYPQPLDQLVIQCEQAGVDYIRGVFIDRVAGDGGLPPFDPLRSIWDTFPRATNASSALGQADPRKVVLARAAVDVNDGKHAPHRMAALRTITGWVQVHHFKWDAALLDRLRLRVSPEWQARFPWWVESQRLLDYFAANGNRFNLADLQEIALHGSHFVAISA